MNSSTVRGTIRRIVILLGLVLALGSIHSRAAEMALRAGDKIQVNIAGVPADEVATISKPYTVGDNGKINLLHIGEITAAGVKPSDLQRRIEQAYKAAEIYTHPNVTVSADATVDQGKQVFVVSGCTSNGPVPYQPNLTLMGAIGSRGGPNPCADMRKVKLTRTAPSGQRTTTTHDLKKYKEDPSVDVVLEPNDLIVIPE